VKDGKKIITKLWGSRRPPPNEIKKAYRKLMKHPRPQCGNKQAEERQGYQRAYAVLSDKKKREQYDQFGPSGFSQRYSQDIFRGFDVSDLFKDLGSLKNDVFPIFGGGGGRPRPNTGVRIFSGSRAARVMISGAPTPEGAEGRGWEGAGYGDGIALTFQEPLQREKNSASTAEPDPKTVKFPPGSAASCASRKGGGGACQRAIL
jgi:curved DNA-binding protein CbpA